LFEPAHELPTSASDAPSAIEPRFEEAKPLPPASHHAGDMRKDSDIQLVAFDDALDEVLDSLKPTSGVKARVADEEEETFGEDATANSTAPSETPPKEPEIAITPQLMELRAKLREALAYYYFRPENVAIRSPWGAMHAMIAYGVDRELIAGDKPAHAIDDPRYDPGCKNFLSSLAVFRPSSLQCASLRRRTAIPAS